MYKVFDKEKCVFFVSGESEAVTDIHAQTVLLDEDQPAINVYRELKGKGRKKNLVIASPDLDRTWKEFSSHFDIIEAAGGRVHNSRGEILFIFRRGKWDLPKGKIEDNEEIREAAIREVEEECGISGLSILHELPSTYHIYTQDDKEVLKRTYWFEMFSDDKRKLVPQEEEGITDVRWMNEKQIKKALKNTYESIIEVMNSLPA
jgi:8-oxo-dGTP pyrophosphatase MutT (NUDIX family)